MAEPADGEPLPLSSDSRGGARDFGVFWAAQTLLVVGDSFALVALPLLDAGATGVPSRRWAC